MPAERFGSSNIILSSANTHSYKKRSVPLWRYLAEGMAPRTLADLGNASFYHFGDNDYDDWKNFTEHYVRPPYNCVSPSQPHLET